MAWRKWLVRGFVFSALGGAGLAALLYQAWTNDTAIRRQVLGKLGDKFAGAVIDVDTAHLRLLGGIAVSELRMARRDDLDRNDFLYAPSVVIYHDKEQLLNGYLAIRKVEMSGPRCRVIRQRDGKFNLAGILGPLKLNEQVPFIVLQHATIVFEDRAGSAPGTVMEIKDVNLTVKNDPLPMLNIEMSGHADVAGPVQIVARMNRNTGETTANIEAAAIPIGPALLQRLVTFAPQAASHLRQVIGLGKIKATVTNRPGAKNPISYDVAAELHGGALAHPRLPLPLEQVEASARVSDGHVPLAHLTARSGSATLDLTIRDAVFPTRANPALEDHVREIDARVEHLPVTPALFACLPPEAQNFQRDYKPTGQVTLTHTFRREGSDGWRKHWVYQPEGMAGAFIKFPYPVDSVTGVVERDTTHEQWQSTTLNITGMARGRPVRLMGKIEGQKSQESVELDIWGDDIPIDEVLLDALPVKNRTQAADFRLSGRTDIKAQVRRDAGHHEFKNRFFCRLRDGAARYKLFPYPVEHVSGVLDILPDHWECRDFRGTHNGGEVRFSGRSFPLPAEPAVAARPGVLATPEKRQRVEVSLQGTNILLDEEFEAALAPPEAPNRAPLQKAWRTLALTGRLSFAADVVDLPNQPQNIDVGVTVQGCAMKPRFFPYALDQVSGTVRYTRDRVWLMGVKACHGTSQLRLREGQVLLKSGGGFQARLAGINGNPLVPDTEFLKSLPPLLRQSLEPLRMREPMAIHTDLVVDVSPEPAIPPLVWWDGTATLHNAQLRAGVQMSNVEGELACCGRHNGRTLEGVSGNFLLRKATLLNQPLANLHGRIEVHPDSPKVLRLHDLHADLFGGTVGGQGRVEFHDGPRYDLVLKAVQVRLEELARHNFPTGAAVEGPLMAALHLSGEGTGIGGLKGNGRVDIPNGKLYRLPLLLDLIKAFGLRAPDRTAFDQAVLVFNLDGPQLQIQQLDLFGNVVSLRGQGTLNLDGSNLNLDFHADWARFMQVLPASFNELPRAVSDQLFKIRMRGRLGEIRYEKEVIPAVTEPIKRAFGR